MRSSILLAMLVTALTGVAAVAQAMPPNAPRASVGNPNASVALRFEDFPSSAGPPARNAPLVLTPRDMTYRTRLRAAATERPNFAGHYVLTVWGCGTECVMGAAINVRTGRVTFLPFSTCCFSEANNGADDMIAFSPDSSLLALIGIRDERRADVGTHYYRIEGDRFVHLRDVPFPARR